MRLSTQIKDSDNNTVNYAIAVTNFETIFGTRTQVNIAVKGTVVGFMQFSLTKYHLYIHRMANNTIHDSSPLKYVGKLLIEYAFNKSVKAGRGGRIELDAIKASPAFYFKIGLRKKTSQGSFLNDLIFEYYADIRKKSAILSNDFYRFLLEDAASYLKKQIHEVTFEEAIEHGLYSPHNDKFAALLKGKDRLTSSDCAIANMQGTMYLPPAAIEQKKAQFSYFIPIGSNLFFSKSQAKARLKNPKLIELVASDQLDASNAIEIEGKMTADDPRLNILLSPIGLKMMKRNYISGWYIGVYFFNITSIEAIISPNGFAAFKSGLVNINQLIKMGDEMRTFVLSDQGLKKLQMGELSISESGCVYEKDKKGNQFKPQGV